MSAVVAGPISTGARARACLLTCLPLLFVLCPLSSASARRRPLLWRRRRRWWWLLSVLFSLSVGFELSWRRVGGLSRGAVRLHGVAVKDREWIGGSGVVELL